ncbi:MAG: peroxiredoxin family protein [Candidatus Melainabacteria bacterium]
MADWKPGKTTRILKAVVHITVIVAVFSVSVVLPALAGGGSISRGTAMDLSQPDPFDAVNPVPVGQPAPDFTLPTADGESVKLSSFKGKHKVVLIFFQGSFCSVCGHQLEGIQSRISDFRKAKTEIIAISADDMTHAMTTLGEHGLTFPVAADPKKTVIRRYGVANVTRNGMAWPSVFIVDTRGIVRTAYADANGNRLQAADILLRLKSVK